MTGQVREGVGTAYKLNEVSMNGDTGAFRIRDILATKGADGKYPARELGASVAGVILKMRWRLYKYVEDADGRGNSISTTEFDNKISDQVIVFPSKDRGIAINMKERYALGMQRVLYVYLPTEHEVVRLFVKATGLSSDKNPNKEKGLFEYVDEFNKTNTMMDEFITTFSGVHREHPQNPRKNHYGMTFTIGRQLTDTEQEKVLTLIQEVHDKTTAAKMPVEAPKPVAENDLDIETESTAVETPNPEDIPF